jgi:hypothetical protein
MRKLPFILGPLLIFAGGWLLLFTFGFASMIDPALEGGAWWKVFWQRVFSSGLSTLVAGLGLIVFGFWVAAGGGRKLTEPPPSSRGEQDR